MAPVVGGAVALGEAAKSSRKRMPSTRSTAAQSSAKEGEPEVSSSSWPRAVSSAASHPASADSLAWSFDARRTDPLPGCHHASCANCLRYAAAWRQRVLRRLGAVQLRLEPVA